MIHDNFDDVSCFKTEFMQFDTPDVAHGTIATLFGVPRYHSFMWEGIVKEQQVLCMVDSGATHSFINEGFVANMGLEVEEFEGF